MAYDEELTNRLRKCIGHKAGLEEKRMMGGVCFMLNGNMACGASHPKGGSPHFMFRLGKDNTAINNLTGGEPMVMAGRLYRGFYLVQSDACGDAMLDKWATAALAFAGSLPAK